MPLVDEPENLEGELSYEVSRADDDDVEAAVPTPEEPLLRESLLPDDVARP